MKIYITSFIILVSASLAIYSDTVGLSLVYNASKPLTTILILFLAFNFNKETDKKYINLILSALVFCLMGDTFLLNEAFFLFGLAAFLLGHILFFLAFRKVYGLSNHILSLLIYGLLGIVYVSYLSDNLNQLLIPVIVYAVAIVLMNWQAYFLYRSEKTYKHLLICIGALLFMFSDSILAYNKFVQSIYLSPLLILSTYWMSIYLIAYSTTLNEKS